MPEADQNLSMYFSLFNEVGIINQLSSSLLERHLPHGLLVSHFSVLNHLTRLGDGKTPLQMARAFQVPKTTMTHTLAGLEKAGLIRFVPNPADGRSKCVMLTEAGANVRAEAIAAMGPDVATLSAVVPPERVAAILPVLEELRRYLDSARDAPQPPS
ncbi:MarR family winged helix-turn-helix transcriptional regulator [Cognatishimia sp. F0-27]|uniref:MarR family winged helix-turn-helix transcriptional regulator n=1 Tax=Cognatishimia sp. F0-27 TaxID=2816855 RepID=UPI001D0C602C|nr:MarR family transcriptional regulator [Cognatishimia sp. F0-27]